MFIASIDPMEMLPIPLAYSCALRIFVFHVENTHTQMTIDQCYNKHVVQLLRKCLLRAREEEEKSGKNDMKLYRSSTQYKRNSSVSNTVVEANETKVLGIPVSLI